MDTHRAKTALCAIGFVVAACGGDDAATTDAGDADVRDSSVVGGDAADTEPDTAGPSLPRFLGPEERRARIVVPPRHDGVTRLPVVFLLHGYRANSILQDAILGTTPAARTLGYYLVLPEGTVDSIGNQFWNATDECCDFDGTGIDDVGYLTSLLDEAESLLPIDTQRVYFMGHSNGGYMSYRMACDLSERVTGIMVLAGSDYKEDDACVPTVGVSVLHIHGTLDDSVLYEGDTNYASALEAATRWAARAGCDPATITDLAPLDLEVTVPGEETSRQRWETGCEPGLDVELWTMNDVEHLPVFEVRPFGVRIGEWLLAHRSD